MGEPQEGAVVETRSLDPSKLQYCTVPAHTRGEVGPGESPAAKCNTTLRDCDVLPRLSHLPVGFLFLLPFQLGFVACSCWVPLPPLGSASWVCPQLGLSPLPAGFHFRLFFQLGAWKKLPCGCRTGGATCNVANDRVLC